MPPDEQHAPEASTTTDASALEPTLSATVVRVAWLAVLLGLGMEILLVIVIAGFGFFPGVKEIVADFVRQVTWSVFVCVGLAFGTVASRMRAQLMGLLGLLSAPLAFNAARVMHQGASKALEIAGPSADTFSVILPLSVLKGIEYAVLGVAIGWVGRRQWGGAKAHIGAGLVIGILFGVPITGLTYLGATSTPSTVDLISRGVNELFFPVGCSLVLYSAEVLGKKAA